jgi:hypothetical protein
MRLEKLEVGIFIFDAIDHVNRKEKILQGIKDMNIHSLIEPPVQVISNTDWHLGPGYIKKYLEHAAPVLCDVVTQLTTATDSPEALLFYGHWFQQYEKGDYHIWHAHNDCAYTCVYYVELPEGSPKTTLRMLGKEYEIDVKEGQVIVFPSCFVHQSKPNKGERKTVISFNVK